MITCGYWCDECRVKYVRHRCKRETLPCGHSFHAAVYVACQAFARSGEYVTLIYGRPKNIVIQDVWLHEERQRNTMYGRGAVTYWGTKVRPFDPTKVRPFDPTKSDWEMWVGEWLSSKPDAVIRAFLSRWASQEWIPEWLAFQQHPAAVRARAVVKYEP